VRSRCFGAVVSLWVLVGCEAQPSAPTRAATVDAGPSMRGPAVVLHPQGRPAVPVRVEVARTEAVRNRGLMFRRELGEGDGMIFVFARPGHYAFWMHNTLIPLDMVFIGADRRVVGVVQRATPETDDPRDVPGEWLYVLEVAGGLTSRWGVRAGDAVEMVGVQPAFE
jgi:uncharacterized membrane protein (UPF0127 family)